MQSQGLSHRRVLALAGPVVIAQAATALTGVVDTAVMGLCGDAANLAAVAVAAAAFGFIYWGFGFLRMATTGLTAQAKGAGEDAETHAVLLRALLLGAALLALWLPLRWLVLSVFDTTPAVAAQTRDYFDARIWGAPALLMGYGVTGWLIGTGRTGKLMLLQVVMNALNAALDAWFVARWDMGPAGIGAGTAIAEWVALGLGLVLVRDGFRAPARLLDRARLEALLAANRDVMIRTLALVFSFAWFVRAGTSIDTATVAGNEVLLQFITVSAFVLDSFAFVAEKEVGEAFGARDAARLRRAVRVTSELALAFGALIALAFLLGGGAVIEFFVRDPEARRAALTYLPFCAATPLIGVPAWQLDGVFLGATRGRALRTAGVAAAVLYVLSDLALRGAYGNTGIWSAFLLMYVYRAACLAGFWPSLVRDLGDPALARGGGDAPR